MSGISGRILGSDGRHEYTTSPFLDTITSPPAWFTSPGSVSGYICIPMADLPPYNANARVDHLEVGSGSLPILNW